MENNLKNFPCKTGEKNLEQPELDITTSEEAVKNMENSDVEKPDGKIDRVLPQKDNPDFEPEFDGDLAHVSWLTMKPFGNKKGF